MPIISSYDSIHLSYYAGYRFAPCLVFFRSDGSFITELTKDEGYAFLQLLKGVFEEENLSEEREQK